MLIRFHYETTNRTVTDVVRDYLNCGDCAKASPGSAAPAAPRPPPDRIISNDIAGYKPFDDGWAGYEEQSITLQ